MDMITSFRIYKALAVTPDLPPLVEAFYMPGAHADMTYASVLQGYEDRSLAALAKFADNSYQVR
jgi:hypothetical protein